MICDFSYKTILPHVPQIKKYNKMIFHNILERSLTGIMQIKKFVTRDLTVHEQFAIERFAYYTDQKSPFVVIGDYSVVLTEWKSTEEQLIEDAIHEMTTITNSHPDFNSYIMDDGNVMIEMGTGQVYSVLEGSKHGLKPTDDTVPMDIALTARQFCLDAAEKNEVVAIVSF